MAYTRQIAYFDLIEYGEKKSGGGFCKWERKEGVHILSISVVGLSGIHDGLAKVFTEDGKELGEVRINNGRVSAVFEKKMSAGDFEWNFSRILIPLADGKKLVAEFETDVAERIKLENEKSGTEKIELGNEKDGVEKTELEFGANMAKNSSNTIEMDKMGGIRQKPEEDFQETHYLQEGAESDQETVLYSLWDCVAKTHEILYPFGTDAEYCKIGLEDILLLKEKYHILRKNQFLFHGYYNYKYLILGRKDADSEEYWLGVPGIYHEREKMAARMYGFEKFEGKKPKYRVGDLGYYLISVE